MGKKWSSVNLLTLNQFHSHGNMWSAVLCEWHYELSVYVCEYVCQSMSWDWHIYYYYCFLLLANCHYLFGYLTIRCFSVWKLRALGVDVFNHFWSSLPMGLSQYNVYCPAFILLTPSMCWTASLHNLHLGFCLLNPLFIYYLKSVLLLPQKFCAFLQAILF